MSTHVTKRSKPEQVLDPPQFHVRPGPAPDPLHFERQHHSMAARIALMLLHWTFALWTLISAWSSRSWIFILQHALCRDIPKAIQADKARLTKIPHHLALIVSQEQAWTNRSPAQWDAIIRDICNTCVWSSELGIKEVSVFEQSGYLKRREPHIQKQRAKALEEYCMGCAGSNGSSVQSTSSKGTFSCVPALPIQHSRLTKMIPTSFKLSIFALEDGKNHVAQVTKQMAVAVTEEDRFTSDEINVQLVDKWMSETVSEPEIAMICYGTAHNYIELSGFFPWHMRLTEFINIPSHKSISYPLFIRAMYNYSKVEQRFGR